MLRLESEFPDGGAELVETLLPSRESFAMIVREVHVRFLLGKALDEEPAEGGWLRKGDLTGGRLRGHTSGGRRPNQRSRHAFDRCGCGGERRDPRARDHH